MPERAKIDLLRTKPVWRALALLPWLACVLIALAAASVGEPAWLTPLIHLSGLGLMGQWYVARHTGVMRREEAELRIEESGVWQGSTLLLPREELRQGFLRPDERHGLVLHLERKGKLDLTDVTFRDDAHVIHVATRIVTEVGRRVDESTPLVDARLKDGSRVNIIIPPLAIDGPTIAIRKFSKKEITLDVMARQNNISADMATVLKIAGRSRLNILISGGTGSGKTTLLNAMSRMIDHGERTVTIEDAAELQLQQPHVVRLETRPANIEGEGEITIRHLLKNALRMRPDRIIVGEIRGEEAIDMLQAMNTGHDGSMGTIHSNTPRDALTRLENMVAMSGFKLPAEAVREQIQSAVHLIVQVSRMRDGKRRITQITEITGMEGDVVTTQNLFRYVYDGENADGTLAGRFECSNLRPHFMPRAEYFGLGTRLLEAMGCRNG